MLTCLENPARVRAFRKLKRGSLKEKAARYEAALTQWFKRRTPANPWDKALAFAEILFNHGLYFDTHEFLESTWNKSSGDKKLCVQGLIQIAAGFHKLELDGKARRGSKELLSKGLDKLARTPSVLGEEITADILATIHRLPPRLRLSKISI